MRRAGATISPNRGVGPLSDRRRQRRLFVLRPPRQPGKSKAFGYTIEFDFQSDETGQPAGKPVPGHGRPGTYDLTLREAIPGLIAFSLKVNHVELPAVRRRRDAQHRLCQSGDGGDLVDRRRRPDPQAAARRTLPLDHRQRDLARLNASTRLPGLAAARDHREGLVEGDQEIARGGSRRGERR